MNSTDITLHAEEGFEMPNFEEKQQYDEADLECIIEKSLHHEMKTVSVRITGE